MFKKILIPLDESELAEQVLPCALRIACQMASEVTLLRAVPPIREKDMTDDGHLIYVDDMMEAAQREAREYLNAIARAVHDQGISVKTALEIGMAADCILDFAQTMGIDLIAMSTHGRSGVGRWVFGSIADRVLRNASCPVLLARASAGNRAVEGRATEPHSFDRILLPLDGSALAERVMPYATELARTFSAEIILTRVVSVPVTIYGTPEAMPLLLDEARNLETEATDYLKDWQARLEQQGLRARIIVSQPPVTESLLEMVRAEKVNLIAMCTHGRSGVRRWVYGSVADRLLQASPIPILLVRVSDAKPIPGEEKSLAIHCN